MVNQRLRVSTDQSVDYFLEHKVVGYEYQRREEGTEQSWGAHRLIAAPLAQELILNQTDSREPTGHLKDRLNLRRNEGLH